MACGAPVVASTASSIPEVVGEAGLLADPRDPHELGEALARVLEEPGLADRLRARGLEQARRFTWERTARELADVLDEVVA
jgi:glycosyltransferase involved in cell wall biosynthesis